MVSFWETDFVSLFLIAPSPDQSVSPLCQPTHRQEEQVDGGDPGEAGGEDNDGFGDCSYDGDINDGVSEGVGCSRLWRFRFYWLADLKNQGPGSQLEKYFEERINFVMLFWRDLSWIIMNIKCKCSQDWLYESCSFNLPAYIILTYENHQKFNLI